ncbi:MAG: molybdopterin converting factor subunit 1 [Dehalococcoidia bacterium]
MIACVKLFAILREKVGTSDLTLELPEGATVDDLLKEMDRRYPTLFDVTSPAMVAVNTEYAQGSHPLHDGDEVALIPPVSGGLR